MNRMFVFVLGLFALLGWMFAGYFYLEAVNLQEDCNGIIPTIHDAVDYYNRVCEESINQDKLTRLLQETKDLDIQIKGETND